MVEEVLLRVCVMMCGRRGFTESVCGGDVWEKRCY